MKIKLQIPRQLRGKVNEGETDTQEMVGACPAMHEVFHLIRRIASSDVPVLVTGASGTGKEMVAQAIHQRSQRARGPFVSVSCGAISPELMESELFGHEKGAFPSAFRTVSGKVERANQGILFLDEVGELPLELQVKLLRFLQEYSFERVGSRETRQVDLRLISTSSHDLKELIAAGKFREDLYCRLNVGNIDLPALKDRGDDCLIMANVFLRRYAAEIGKKILGFSQGAVKAIQNYLWPGNVRELINRIRRAVVMAEDDWITSENLGLELQPLPLEGLGLEEAMARFHAKLVDGALSECRGNVQSAAKLLKTFLSDLCHLIEKHGLMQFQAGGLAKRRRRIPPRADRLTLS